jgi:hypothetical protein
MGLGTGDAAEPRYLPETSRRITKTILTLG